MKPLLILNLPDAPIAVANNFPVPEEPAPKIGSVTFCFLKTLIAVRFAMGGSFAPVTAIIMRSTCITTPKIDRARLTLAC